MTLSASDADTTSSGDRLPDWHVEVDGCVNFRDVGGWATVDGGSVRSGRLYRSDDPIRITSAGRAAVERLGLAMVIDLRQQSQFSRAPGFVEPARTAHVALVDQVVDPVNPPPLDTPRDIANLYVGMLDESRERIGEVLDLIAETLSAGPVLVHCAFGKDRAGLITAIVHAAVGVRPEHIVADYVRSDGPARRRRAAMLAAPLPDDPPIGRLPEALFRATSDTIEVLLEHVLNRYGSLDDWVASFPTAPGTLARLRSEMVRR